MELANILVVIFAVSCLQFAGSRASSEEIIAEHDGGHRFTSIGISDFLDEIMNMGDDKDVSVEIKVNAKGRLNGNHDKVYHASIGDLLSQVIDAAKRLPLIGDFVKGILRHGGHKDGGSKYRHKAKDGLHPLIKGTHHEVKGIYDIIPIIGGHKSRSDKDEHHANGGLGALLLRSKDFLKKYNRNPVIENIVKGIKKVPGGHKKDSHKDEHHKKDSIFFPDFLNKNKDHVKTDPSKDLFKKFSGTAEKNKIFGNFVKGMHKPGHKNAGDKDGQKSKDGIGTGLEKGAGGITGKLNWLTEHHDDKQNQLKTLGLNQVKKGDIDRLFYPDFLNKNKDHVKTDPTHLQRLPPGFDNHFNMATSSPFHQIDFARDQVKHNSETTHHDSKSDHSTNKGTEENKVVGSSAGGNTKSGSNASPGTNVEGNLGAASPTNTGANVGGSVGTGSTASTGLNVEGSIGANAGGNLGAGSNTGTNTWANVGKTGSGGTSPSAGTGTNAEGNLGAASNSNTGTSAVGNLGPGSTANAGTNVEGNLGTGSTSNSGNNIGGAGSGGASSGGASSGGASSGGASSGGASSGGAGSVGTKS